MPVIFAETITELKSETFISCNFSGFSVVSFCHFQKRSSHLVSQNTSSHARHVSLDGMEVCESPQKISGARSKCWNFRDCCEPDGKNAGITGIFCEPHSQNAGIVGVCYVFLVNQTVNMLEVVGPLVKHTVKMLAFL